MGNNLKPNTKYCKVNGKFYAVNNPSGYIKKCLEDGKMATYEGKTDNNGKLAYND